MSVPVGAWQRARLHRAAIAYFYETPERAALLDLVGGTISTGASITDYWLLHRLVKRQRPRRILELGGGATTVILASALRELETETASAEPTRLYSMEDVPLYHRHTLDLLPDHLRPLVTLCLTDKIACKWTGCIEGVRYRQLPDEDFDLVFVDGPDEMNGHRKGACLDLLYLLRDKPTLSLSVLIDNKLPTQGAIQSVLPNGRLRRDDLLKVAFAKQLSGTELLYEVSPRHVVEAANAIEYFDLNG